MEDLAIQIEHVSKIYKLYEKPSDRMKEALGFGRHVKATEKYALNDVGFDVKRGETVGIIGTNGSGKSTILKIITGVLNPTMGEVKINGRISALLELGAGFNMEYNGIENVYLNGTMIGFSKEEIDAKLNDILAFADIGEYAAVCGGIGAWCAPDGALVHAYYLVDIFYAFDILVGQGLFERAVELL